MTAVDKFSAEALDLGQGRANSTAERTAVSDAYDLSRDTYESKRLEIQQNLWNQTLSYDLHPYLQQALPQTGGRIADIACGTGAWLVSIANGLTNDHVLDGFDISASQFPPEDSLPQNIRLHVVDAKHPFPARYHGVFDVVHLRLLVCALERDDWQVIARNVFQILRPGGHIQWDEGDFTTVSTVCRSEPIVPSALELNAHDSKSSDSTLSDLARLVIGLQKHKFVHGWSTLESDLQEAGFVDVRNDVVAADRLIELRRPFTVIGIGAYRGILSTCAKKGMQGVPTLEEVTKMCDSATEAAENGFYYNFNIWIWMGKKPE